MLAPKILENRNPGNVWASPGRSWAPPEGSVALQRPLGTLQEVVEGSGLGRGRQRGLGRDRFPPREAIPLAQLSRRAKSTASLRSALLRSAED